jgi:hypothetical protein
LLKAIFKPLILEAFMTTNSICALAWRTLQTAALAVLILLGGEVRGSVAKPATRGGGTVVIIWPAVGPVSGVGVNGKVVWPPGEIGRNVPGSGTTVVIWAHGKAVQKFSEGNGSTVIVWPRTSKRRY